MPAITVEVNGVSKSFMLNSLRHDNSARNVGSASCTFISQLSGASAYVPVHGQTFVVKNAGTAVWGGEIVSISEAYAIEGSGTAVTVQAQDFSRFLDDAVVNFDIADGAYTEKSLIAYLIATYLGPDYSITADGAMTDGMTLPAMSFPDVTAREVLNEVSKLSGRVYRLTPTLVLMEYTVGFAGALFSLGEADVLLGTTVSNVEPAGNYYNSVSVTGAFTQRDTIVGDGVATSWPLQFTAVLDSSGWIVFNGLIEEPTYNSPYGVFGVDSTAWTFDPATNTLHHTTPLAVGYTVVFPYTVSVVSYEDAAEVAAHKRRKRRFPSATATTADSAYLAAQALVRIGIAGAAKRVTLTTRVGLPYPTQVITLNIPSRNVALDAYLIESAGCTYLENGTNEVTISARQGVELGSEWQDLFAGGGSSGGSVVINGSGTSTGGLTGVGVVGYLPLWIGDGVLGQSIFLQSGASGYVQGSFTVTSTAPVLEFDDTDNGANARYMRFLLNAGVFAIQSVVDDHTSATTLWTLARATGNMAVLGSITAGSGAVGIVDITGKIPAISSTYFASLSGANLTGVPETAITDGAILARVAANETISGTWSFSAAPYISGTAPSLNFYETDEAANAKRWRWLASGQVLSLDIVNDAESSAITLLAFARSGGATFAFAPTISGTAPYLNWYESDETGDAKYWRALVSAQVFTIDKVNDAYTVPVTLLSLSRAGALAVLAGISGTTGAFSAGLSATTGTFTGTTLSLTNAAATLTVTNGTGTATVQPDFFGIGGATGYVGTSTAHPLILVSNNADRGRIHASGGLSWGNTTDPGATNFNLSGFIGHPSYVSQSTNWRVTAAGEADFRYLFVDEMHAKSFIADLEQALAGGQIITKSVAMVAQAFTAPAAGDHTTLWVRDLPSAPNMAVFESGDTVVLRSFSRASGALVVADCIGVVTSYSDGTGADAGTQSWLFTRNTAANAGTLATGVVVAVDSLALDHGPSGSGYYEVSAIDGTTTVTSITRSGSTATVTTSSPHGLLTNDLPWISGAAQADYNGVHLIVVTSATTFEYTVANSPATPATGTILVNGTNGTNAPYAQIVTWVTSPIGANKTLRARFGNLRGVTGTAGEYGILAGTYAATGGTYFRASNSAFELHGIDLKLWDGSTNTVLLNHSTPSFALGSPVPSAYGTGTGIWMGKDTTYKFRVGVPAGNRVAWDGTDLTLVAANTSIDSTGISIIPNTTDIFASDHAYRFTVSNGALGAAGTDLSAARSYFIQSTVTSGTAKPLVELSVKYLTNPRAFFSISGGIPSDATSTAILLASDISLQGNVDVTGTISSNGTAKFGDRASALSYVGVFVVPSLTASTDAAGVQISPMFGAGTSGSSYGASIATASADGSYTITNAYGLRIHDGTKGAGSTWTNQYSLYIDTPTAGGTINRAIKVVGGITELGGTLQTGTGVDTTAYAQSNANLLMGNNAEALGVAGSTISNINFYINGVSYRKATIQAGNSGTDGGLLVFYTKPDNGGGAQTDVVLAGYVANNGGLVWGSPTGGSKGAGSINVAADIYKNNVAYTNPKWVLQRYFTGRADTEGPYVVPTWYAGLYTLDEHRQGVRAALDLPLMLGDPHGGIFARGDLLLASLEEAYLYIYQLHDRITTLERRAA